MLKNYLIDALKYKSNRRLNLVRLFQSIGSANNCLQQSEEIVLEIIENIHSSASIIDDMLDNESTRKGLPSYYIRNGYSVASFASLNLMVSAIEKINHHYKNPTEFLRHIRNMIDAEEADLNLCQRPEEIDIMKWYYNQVSVKISEELMVMLLLCFEGKFETEKSKITSNTIYEFGKQIQFCNDWYDILVRDPFARVEDDNYVFTYSLPLALYLQSEPKIERIVGKKTNKKDAKLILDKIREGKINEQVKQIIDSNHEKIVSTIKNNNLNELNPLILFLEKIKTNSYWEGD
jgi:geranylgeranyl pyrophosphate synthase